jgi:hypothetical protein
MVCCAIPWAHAREHVVPASPMMRPLQSQGSMEEVRHPSLLSGEATHPGNFDNQSFDLATSWIAARIASKAAMLADTPSGPHRDHELARCADAHRVVVRCIDFAGGLMAPVVVDVVAAVIIVDLATVGNVTEPRGRFACRTSRSLMNASPIVRPLSVLALFGRRGGEAAPSTRHDLPRTRSRRRSCLPRRLRSRRCR